MTDLVIGLGQIGQPIFKHLSEHIDVLAKDIEEIVVLDPIEALHICFGFDDDLHYRGWFVDTVDNYIDQYNPNLCFIHSTVLPGTSRRIQALNPFTDVIYSPVVGRHGQLEQDLKRYSKWIAAYHIPALQNAMLHLSGIWALRAMHQYEDLELAKLLQTTYTAVLVVWAQEMHRFSEACDADDNISVRFMSELDYLPAYQFIPGFIGGHCIMPNIELLQAIRNSAFLTAMQESNEQRKEEIVEKGGEIVRRVWPIKLR